jgi:hypothetical protein
VRIEGAPMELSALAGDWEGEYSSAATGRLGSIVFKLVAGEDHAHGDVLMIPRGSSDPYRPRSGGEGPAPAGASQLLTIRFVRAEAGRISGTLDPYWDPDCNCEVTTTFVGEARGDAIEGTFSSERIRSDRVRSVEAEAVQRYLENWKGEQDGAALYDAVASCESNPKLAEVYRRLAATERHHAEVWAEKLRVAGVTTPQFRPSTRTRILTWLCRAFSRSNRRTATSTTRSPKLARRGCPGMSTRTPACSATFSAPAAECRAPTSRASRADIARRAATRCAPRSSGRTTVSSRISRSSWESPAPTSPRRSSS